MVSTPAKFTLAMQSQSGINARIKQMTTIAAVVYHLHKISANSVWNVDGTHRFSSSRWKIFRNEREFKKGCPVFPNGNSGKIVYHLYILTSSRPLTSLSSRPNASKSARSAQTCTLKSSKWLITFRSCMNVQRVMLLLQIR